MILPQTSLYSFNVFLSLKFLSLSFLFNETWILDPIWICLDQEIAEGVGRRLQLKGRGKCWLLHRIPPQP